MQLKTNKDIDKEITEYLNNKSEEVSAPDNMFFKIRGGIEMKHSNKRFTLKTGLIAATICIAATVTCIAATKGAMWIGSSSPSTKSNEKPNVSTLNDMVGFVPKYVDSFDGGFKFKSFNFGNESYIDESGNETYKGKSARFEYARNDEEKNKQLRLTAVKIDEKAIQNEATEEKVDYNSVDIYYTSFKYKAVPADYTKTEEDLKLELEGKLQIGYGAEEEKTSEDTVQHVSWYEDGISYSILNSNYDDVSKDDMIKMAKDIIDK